MADVGPPPPPGDGGAGPSSSDAQTADEIMAEQEAKLMARYGMKPKKKLIQKDHAFFDSADWALAKEKGDATRSAVQGTPAVPAAPTPPSIPETGGAEHAPTPMN